MKRLKEMKDTEIHNGLPEKEIRDFFSKSVVDTEEKTRYKGCEYTDEDDMVNQIKRKKDHMNLLLKDLEKLEIFKAIRDLARLKGWDEYDVSDHIQKTGYTWRNFYGTEREFEVFCKNNKIDYE